MPVINHSFSDKSRDPFRNLTVEVTDDKVLFGVHSYEKSEVINLDHAETRRLIQTLEKELARA